MPAIVAKLAAFEEWNLVSYYKKQCTIQIWLSHIAQQQIFYLCIYIFNRSNVQFQIQTKLPKKQCKHILCIFSLVVNMTVIPVSTTWSWDGDLIDTIMHYNIHLIVITCWKQYRCMNKNLHLLVLSASDSHTLNRTHLGFNIITIYCSAKMYLQLFTRSKTKDARHHHHRVTTQWCHQ